MRYTFNLKKAYDDYYLYSINTVYGTGKKSRSEYVSPYKENYYVPEHNITKRMCYNKLGKYEDIEEKLGIDLIVFGKVLQALDRECIYVKIKETKQYDGYSLDEETGEIRRCVIVRFSRYSNGLRDWFFTISWGDLSSTKQYLLKDYGKTWALTKEELL